MGVCLLVLRGVGVDPGPCHWDATGKITVQYRRPMTATEIAGLPLQQALRLPELGGIRSQAAMLRHWDAIPG